MPPDDTIGSTAYAVEYSCSVNRAVTPVTVEMTACAVAHSVFELLAAAWSDGSNWTDDAIGWTDWPPSDD